MRNEVNCWRCSCRSARVCLMQVSHECGSAYAMFSSAQVRWRDYTGLAVKDHVADEALRARKQPRIDWHPLAGSWWKIGGQCARMKAELSHDGHAMVRLAFVSKAP
jgi:hypothetical protein